VIPADQGAPAAGAKAKAEVKEVKPKAKKGRHVSDNGDGGGRSRKGITPTRSDLTTVGTSTLD
jgi:hypothetical protein